MLLVTGGAGFIGANFVLDWIAGVGEPVVTLDKLTYAGNPRNLSALGADARHRLVVGDIGDSALVVALLAEHRPRAVLNFAAESHVDRSIHGPAAFVETNLLATFRLLEAVLGYWQALPSSEQAAFRFLHVSTDEVYGSLGAADPAFNEQTPYAPNSPYSATKAGSDHLVRAYHHTYGLPVLTTNCSNNYGPYQFPEKLIPLIIHNALSGRPLPIYGDGLNVRDWLYVGDHCSAVRRVLEAGVPGRVYNIGGNQERTNLEIVRLICDRLDALRPDPAGAYQRLIRFVDDRPGHDRRYAIDATRIERELGWRPVETFASGIERTIDWYLAHADWVDSVVSGEYRQWVQRQYGDHE
jgi:dTDP-glucose 4,6-dehydratase